MPISSTTYATPSLLPPTSIRTAYGMPISSTTSATPSLLPPTSVRTTYGMPVSSTVSIMRFSQFYTSSIQNRTTAFTHVGKSLELSFLLSVIIGPSLGLIIILVGLYIYTRRMIARRHRRINQHEQQTSQIELLTFAPCESSKTIVCEFSEKTPETLRYFRQIM